MSHDIKKEFAKQFAPNATEAASRDSMTTTTGRHASQLNASMLRFNLKDGRCYMVMPDAVRLVVGMGEEQILLTTPDIDVMIEGKNLSPLLNQLQRQTVDTISEGSEIDDMSIYTIQINLSGDGIPQ